MDISKDLWTTVSQIGFLNKHAYIGNIEINIMCHFPHNGGLRLINSCDYETIHNQDLYSGYHKIKIEVKKCGIFEIQVKGKSVSFRGYKADDLTYCRKS